MTTQHLTAGQLAGLTRLGDVLVPGDGELPRFSATRAAEHADRVLAFLKQSDRDGIRLLLGASRFLPKPVLRGIFRLTGAQRRFPDWLGRPLRLLELGLKGLVMTLYYSDVGEGASILKTLEWNASVLERGD